MRLLALHATRYNSVPFGDRFLQALFHLAERRVEQVKKQEKK
jgi:hypothetical protein